MNKNRKNIILDKKIIKEALIKSIEKLNPRIQLNNFVMFIVYICAIVTTIITVKNLVSEEIFSFNLQISLWLWFTVLFANFAESLAEGKGKAQADSLRKNKKGVLSKKIINDSKETQTVKAEELKKGDLVLCSAGDIIPSDGEVVEGIAAIDESAITGESAPVIRESGGDKSAVTGGTKIISDQIIIKITVESGNTFIDRLIMMVEGAKRKKTPNEIALNILLVSLTLIFILIVFSLKGFIIFTENFLGINNSNGSTIPILISLLVCLIPTTIGGLLSAIGISGIERLISKNVIAINGRAVEAAGDVDVLLLDKTGTITLGNRMATEFIPSSGVSETELAKASQLASIADETPEGRSILKFIKHRYGLREFDLTKLKARYFPFSAKTKISGVLIPQHDDIPEQLIKKGAVDAILEYLHSIGSNMPEEVIKNANDVSKDGATPLVVVNNNRVLGIIVLRDVIKQGIKEKFKELRKMGIKSIMITGDNPLTASAIAFEAGVDDFIAEAKPETKLKVIQDQQNKGHMVAMIGDGTNDAPALAQADVGVVMNSGTQAAREAGNMVDLDNNPTKLIDIIETGKQILITRGALTTFSISNDIAKYFAILPALFCGLYLNNHGESLLSFLNIMHLSSPNSAILSAVIFNAIIIIALIPLALRGIKYRPKGAKSNLLYNVIIYGLGGIISPFVGIKLIDIAINFLGLV